MLLSKPTTKKTVISENEKEKYAAEEIASAIKDAIEYGVREWKEAGRISEPSIGQLLIWDEIYDPSTMKDEDIIAFVTPLLQELVLNYLDDARDVQERNCDE